MVNAPVLVLNLGYEPLNICRVRRAIILIEEQKAEMLENGSGFIYSAGRSFAVPTVIRVSSMARRPRRPNRKLTRMEIFRRDQYACQYCGKKAKQLTLDHVIPRYRGGPHTWDNVVTAKITEYVNVNFNFQIFYDHIISSQRQIMQSLAIGISYSIL